MLHLIQNCPCYKKELEKQKNKIINSSQQTVQIKKEKGRVIFLNAQGFLKHKDEIENLLLEEVRPDIIGFTETHVTNSVEDRQIEIGD